MLRLLPLLCLLAVQSNGQSRPPAAKPGAKEDALQHHIQAARDAQGQQDCKTAAHEYGLAARLMPSSAELLTNQGIALYCDQQMTEAEAVLHRAIVLKPGLFAPHLFLGLAAYHLGEDEAAIRELKSAVQINASDPTAHLWLGLSFIADHQYEPALVQFQSATHIDPANVDAQYALGQTYLEIGRRKARALETLAPHSPQILQLAAEQYRSIGDEVHAQQAEKRLAEREVNAAEAPRQDALYREAHEAEVNAQAAFQAVLRQAPDSDRAHEIMGDVYVAMQQTGAAIAAYREVLAANPALPGIHQAISNCEMQNGQFTDALAELKAEQKLQPRSAEVLMAIGRVQIQMGKNAEALDTLRAVMALREPPPETYLLMGKAMLNTGDAQGAIKQLQHFVALQPDTAAAYYALARAYRSVGDRTASARALEDYKRTSQDGEERRLLQAVTQDPKTPEMQ